MTSQIISKQTREIVVQQFSTRTQQQHNQKRRGRIINLIKTIQSFLFLNMINILIYIFANRQHCNGYKKTCWSDLSTHFFLKRVCHQPRCCNQPRWPGGGLQYTPRLLRLQVFMMHFDNVYFDLGSLSSGPLYRESLGTYTNWKWFSAVTPGLETENCPRRPRCHPLGCEWGRLDVKGPPLGRDRGLVVLRTTLQFCVCGKKPFISESTKNTTREEVTPFHV